MLQCNSIINTGVRGSFVHCLNAQFKSVVSKTHKTQTLSLKRKHPHHISSLVLLYQHQEISVKPCNVFSDTLRNQCNLKKTNKPVKTPIISQSFLQSYSVFLKEKTKQMPRERKQTGRQWGRGLDRLIIRKSHIYRWNVNLDCLLLWCWTLFHGEVLKPMCALIDEE